MGDTVTISKLNDKVSYVKNLISNLISTKNEDGVFFPIYKLAYALRNGFTWWELFLNILFIIIIIIFSMIIYWNSINARVAATSRCKRQLDIFNKNKGVYVINATDRSKEPLFKITYDTNQNNTDVECTCKTGKYVNYFKDIKIKDTKNNNDTKVEKICSCDKYYNVGLIDENIIYDGEPGILRYMTADNSDFFDNMLFSSYDVTS
jgi:hypothetical protein